MTNIIEFIKQNIAPRSYHAERFLVNVISGFVGMIIALCWYSILDNSIQLIAKKFPILALFGGVTLAIIVTLLCLIFGFYFFNNIKTEEDEDKIKNQEEKEKERWAREKEIEKIALAAKTAAKQEETKTTKEKTEEKQKEIPTEKESKKT